MEAGSFRLEVGSSRLEAGDCKLVARSCRLKLKAGGWRVEAADWRLEAAKAGVQAQQKKGSTCFGWPGFGCIRWITQVILALSASQTDAVAARKRIATTGEIPRE